MSAKHESDARRVAVQVLVRVEKDEAFAAAVLQRLLADAKLSSRDAALATEITYGTLRYCALIDQELDAVLSQPRSKLDGYVLAAMRTALYQIRCLSRVPAFAAVNAAVGLVRRERGARLAGLTNACLRKLVREAQGLATKQGSETDGPSRAMPSRELYKKQLVLPDWVRDKLMEALGAQRLAAIEQGGGSAPFTCLRLRQGIDAVQLTRRIESVAPHAEVAPGLFLPNVLQVRRAGPVKALPGYAEGAFVVQEEGAQIACLAAGVKPGERVLDACAGRGNKTTQLLEAVGKQGHVTAVDLYEEKLEQIEVECRRLGIGTTNLETAPIDMSVGTASLRAEYDAVLVDAPCSGLGTVLRRPEILLRLAPEDIDELQALQCKIVLRAASLLAPGGRLVYVVCSPTREEGLELPGLVEARFLELGLTELRRVPVSVNALPDTLMTACAEGDGLSEGLLRIGPWCTPAGRDQSARPSLDAYQILQWQRVSF